MGIEDSWRNVVRTFIRLGIAQQKHFSSSTMQIAHCTLYFAHCSLNILLYTLLQIAAHCRLQHIAYCTSHIALVGCRFETASQCITVHHSASQCITVHHSASKCITVHHGLNQIILINQRSVCATNQPKMSHFLTVLKARNVSKWLQRKILWPSGTFPDKCFESEIFWQWNQRKKYLN